jgi:hypothetical protein
MKMGFFYLPILKSIPPACCFDTREEILLNQKAGPGVPSGQDKGFLCHRYDSMHAFLSQGTIHLGGRERSDLYGP